MKRVPWSFRAISIFFIALALGLAAQPVEAAPGKERVQLIKNAVGVHKRHVRQLMANRDVIASGVSLDAKGNPVIRVLVANEHAAVPDRFEGIRVHKQKTARIVALRGPTCDTSGTFVCSTEERWPLPVPVGVSVGHPAISAGTIGARVTDGSNVFILSNNHVIADNNNAVIGDNILQPGVFDGGADNDDAIATLTDYEPITFSGNNTMDAGIALTTPAEVGISTPVGEYGSIVGYGVPNAELHPAYGDPSVIGDENMALLLGTAVQKVGRTTGATSGSVTTVNASVSVCYDSPSCSLIATFVDQIIISPAGFSAGGDSGSLIVTDDAFNQAVGLLYAGNGTITIANRIDVVLDRFGVTIDDGQTGNERPVASFTANPTTGTTTVDFDASASYDSDGAVISYNWDFGDGNSGTGATTSHTYTGPGSFNVRLVVTDDRGSTGATVQAVTVEPVPGAVCISAICDNGDLGFAAVGFWTESTSSPGYYGSSYLHDQRADKGNKTASWTYTIAEDGNYQVAAQWASWANRARDVQYRYSVDGGPEQNCGPTWDQRYNGGQFNELCVVPTLAAGSTLVISLRNDSASYVIADAVRVQLDPGGPLPPVAEFSFSQVPDTLTIDFDASASYDPDGTIVRYDWDFGDGTTGTGVSPSHTYPLAGGYSVTLTVTGDYDATDQVTQTVGVQPPGGGVCPGEICDNSDNGFEVFGDWASSTSSPGYYGSNYLHDKRAGKGSKTASWTWDVVADGNYELAAQWPASLNRAPAVQYMYSIDGGSPQNCGDPADQRYNGGALNKLCTVSGLLAGSTLTLSLRNDSYGYVIADAARFRLDMGGPLPPVASFSAGQVTDTLTVDFDASASYDPDGTIVDYAWDYGDGNFGTGVTASHTYAAPGSYSVTLTVTGDFGATDQETQDVNVVPSGGGVCPGVVCDNLDLGFNSVGLWSSSTSSPGYVGGDYLHDRRADKGNKTVSWTYAITAGGNYEVAAQWTSSSNRAPFAQYMYSIDGGPSQNCGAPADQRYNGGQMNYLCTVTGLVAGSTLTISLRNDSNGYVIADAVSVGLQ